MRWKTKEGRVLDIKDMGDEHLLNAHRMLRRKIVEAQECTQMYCHPIFGHTLGSMAELAADQAMNKIWDKELVYRAGTQMLKKEIDERGLKEKPVDGPRPLPKIKSVELLNGGTLVELEKEVPAHIIEPKIPKREQIK